VPNESLCQVVEFPDGRQLAVEARPAWSPRRGRLEQALRSGASLMQTGDTASWGVASVKVPVVGLAYALSACLRRGSALVRRDQRWRVQIVEERERRVLSTISCADRDEAQTVLRREVAVFVEQGASPRRLASWTVAKPG
jgi:hypothetical protein